MAHTASTILEVRPTGNAANGGGFDPTVASPGTDFSQQASPQFAYTDLVISGSTLTSAAFPFDSTIPGNLLHITGGTGFTTGWYRCVSVSGSTVTLDRSPGTNASTGGQGKLGGAFATLADADSFAVAGMVYHAVGAFSIGGTTITVNATGADNAPLTVIGHATSRADSGFATFTSTGANPGTMVNWTGANVTVRNCSFDGANVADRGAVISGAGGLFYNSKATRCNLTGLFASGDYGAMYFCEADNSAGGASTGGGLYFARFCIGYGCKATSNQGNGFGCGNNNYSLYECLAANNTQSGFFTSGSGNVQMWHCTSHGNTLDGLRLKDTFSENITTVINCLFTSNAGYAIRSLTTDYSVAANAQYPVTRILNNAFYNNSLGKYFQVATGTGDINLTGDPYNSAATGDFSLNFTAAAGALLHGAGVIGALGVQTNPDAAPLTKRDIGAVQGLAINATVSMINAAVAGVAPSIDEVQFPTGISEGAQGGPSFSTIVVVAGNGIEQRVPLYTHGRYAWNAATGLKSPSDMAQITAFWLARQGRARGFRWKDWDDYQATGEALTITGGPTAQLQKTYTSGAVSYGRVIYKPVAGSVTVTRNASPYAAWTLDTTSGVLTWTAINQKAITGITKASSAVITVGASHGFVVGDVVYIAGVTGMVEINTHIVTVTAIASTTITVNLDSTGFTTYVSGGTVTKYVQPTDVVQASFQFDVPVRFDTDQMVMEQTSSQIRSLPTLPVIELTGG